MRIGLFTFSQSNYGAVLQAFALQRYLREQPGVNVEIIDFTTPIHLKDQKIFRKPKSAHLVSRIVYYLFTLFRYHQLKQRLSKTIEFKKKYFHYTRRFSSVEDVLENYPQEDVYITGSDQVFNPNAQFYPVYYLGFDKGNAKKVAYAPSFGISAFNDEITARIEHYIMDFDYLSCREPAGAEYLKLIVGCDVPVVVDPVLLYDAKEWSKIAISPQFKKDFILIYDLNGAEKLLLIAKKIQAQKHLPIVCLTGNRTKIYPVCKQVYDAGPAEFIGWIKDASFVVTDSFHGTVFSIIFRKQFFTFVALENTSSRIRSILSKVGLEKRIVSISDVENLDYSDYHGKTISTLDDIISDSKKYIDCFLSC